MLINLSNIKWLKKSYILIFLIIFAFTTYAQKDSLLTDRNLGSSIKDSVITGMQIIKDSSIADTLFNNTVKDSILINTQPIVDTIFDNSINDSVLINSQSIEDSSVTDTLFNNTVQDSLITDKQAQGDSLSEFAPINEIVKDSIFKNVNPQDISDQSGYVIENLGKWGKLRIYGSMRLNGAYDLNGLTNTNSFSTYDILVGEEVNDQARFFMTPYQSRLGVEVTRSGLIKNFRIKIETDFLGANNGLRIRHAFVETGNFVIGQTWSTFTDQNSVPQTVDVDGPNSSVQLRTVRIRYSDMISHNKLKFIVSLEAPNPDVVLPDSLKDLIPAQFLPDAAGQLIYKYTEGYLSLASIIRGITVKDSSGSYDQIIGYGFLLSGDYNLDAKNKFLFQGVYGAAISRFIRALNGKGLDLVYNPNNNNFQATISFGLLASYLHNWRSDISSAFTVGMVGINNKDYEPADAFSQSWYYSANVYWNALLGVRFGLEVANGRRINKDGNYGNATRIGFIFYADF